MRLMGLFHRVALLIILQTKKKCFGGYSCEEPEKRKVEHTSRLPRSMCPRSSYFGTQSGISFSSSTWTVGGNTHSSAKHILSMPSFQRKTLIILLSLQGVTPCESQAYPTKNISGKKASRMDSSFYISTLPPLTSTKSSLSKNCLRGAILASASRVQALGCSLRRTATPFRGISNTLERFQSDNGKGGGEVGGGLRDENGENNTNLLIRQAS